MSICADGELYYTRNLDWDTRLAEPAKLRAAQPEAAKEQPLGYEYMPGGNLDQEAFAVLHEQHGAGSFAYAV
ncbi:hypothetical protein ACVBEH_32640, partial [Roseateles sp. GG27B]